MPPRTVYLFSGVHTAIGDYDARLENTPPAALAGLLATERSNAPPPRPTREQAAGTRSGAMNTTKLVQERARTGACHGLVTMCIGGGQGIAAIFEQI